MAWKTVDIHEQRVRFVVAAMQRLQPFSSLCAEFRISRPTGYLWLRRYKQDGIRGIAERKPGFPGKYDGQWERCIDTNS